MRKRKTDLSFPPVSSFLLHLLKCEGPSLSLSLTELTNKAIEEGINPWDQKVTLITFVSCQVLLTSFRGKIDKGSEWPLPKKALPSGAALKPSAL